MSDLARLRELMDKVTANELDSIVSQIDLRHTFPIGEGPSFWRDKTKRDNVTWLVRWAGRHPEHGAILAEWLEKQVAEKAAQPVRGPVGGTRYIPWDEWTALPAFRLIERALRYPHDARRKCSPVTKDGYVSVDAIYNLSAWASWKSSSLGQADFMTAEAIHKLPLGVIMGLNKGRRNDQPALFPETLLPFRR